MPLEILNLDDATQESIEQLGTKRKFWTTLPGRGRCLCKLPRPGTGEDWSEVVSAHIAALMGLPHAEYLLGELLGMPTVVSPSFAEPPEKNLVVGNALLMAVNPIYNVGAVKYRQKTHTIDVVMTLLENASIEMPAGSPVNASIKTPADIFVGYLALDALVGNTDRHHENWGWVVELGDHPVVRLAPTFDHASSLGCHETETRKEVGLTTRDSNQSCAAYARRARSAFFLNAGDPRPMLTHAAFLEAARRHPEAAQYWIQSILNNGRETFDILLGEVPPHRLSDLSRRFALEILMSNHRTLAEVQL